MLTWEWLQGPDGSECLRVQISPEIPLPEAHLMLLNLTRLASTTEQELDDPLDGDWEHPRESRGSCFGTRNPKRPDSQN